MIPEGTPIAQVIPFKRNSWKMSIGNEKNIIEIEKQTLRLNSKIFDAYKTKFWNKKSFK